MNKHSLKIMVPTLVVSLAAIMAHADYSNEVESLGAAAYWPLQETKAPPAIYYATNSGTLGGQADGYYNNIYNRSGATYDPMSYFTGPVAGVTSDGAAASFFNGGTNNDSNAGYMLVPDINHDLDPGIPFSAEVWVKPGGGDPNDVTGTSFSSTEWTTLVGKGGGGYVIAAPGDANGNTYGWSIELAGIYTLGYPVGWYTPGTIFLKTNALWVVDFYNGASGGNPSLEFMVPMYEPTPQWFHLALTYDGTNANFYTNGVLAATTLPNLPQSTNDVYGPAQSPITSANGDYELAGFAPDTINPMCIGDLNDQADLSNVGYPNTPDGTVGYNCQNYNGAMADLAYYTNALSPSTVLQHYQDATAANTTLYTNDVLSAHPLVYLRFNDPASVFQEPPTNFSTFPVATNYGSASGYNGLYQPGATPGIAGPSLPGLGSLTNAVQFNGFDSAVDIGDAKLSGTIFDPTNNQPVSISYWFKGNPADIYGRFQGIVGRGDSGWRSSLDGSGLIRWNPGAGPELASPQSYNDGNWHHVVGVSDGVNDFLYVDGQLVASGTGVGALSGTSPDIFVGGAPDYTTGDHSAARYLSGQVTQFAYFTNALSAGQAEALYYSAASLTPVITANPQEASANQGSGASFSVTASGAPLGYEWYLGTTKLTDSAGNISGSSTANLTISDAQSANAGNYTVVVTNSFGSVTSSPALLTVYTSVVITSDIFPSNDVLFVGGHSTFSITAGGEPPITYQWYSNTLAVAGATNASYELNNAQGTAGIYCKAANSYNSVSSSTASLTVITATNSYPTAIIGANPVGYWRLNEPDNGAGNDGVTAHDYWGGNDGIYTNTVLDQQGYNLSEPTETSAEFGLLSFSNCMVYNIPLSVDFSAPTGSNSSFSVECWVNGYQQTSDAGIVSKGNSGTEQFDLDTGAYDPSHYLRFLIRDASGATHIVNSSNQLDGAWQYVVAVCNEPSNYIALYVDGVLVGQTSITTGSGLLTNNANMKIGARPSTSDPTYNSDQFEGNLDDVAVYGYALSAAEVQAHYNSGSIPAAITVQPGNVEAGAGGNATFVAQVQGTPPLTNQWYNASTGQPVPGATNTSLVLNDVTAADNGDGYYLTTANALGSQQSQSASLTVISGAPQIYTDVQSPFFAVENGTASDSVAAYGTEPLTYQWQFKGANLTDGDGITGSQSNVLTIANAQPAEAGNYQVIASNGSGSVTSSVALFIVGSSPVGFDISGGGWEANGDSTINSNLLTLTDGAGGEASSFFYNYPQYIGAFKASYTYQDVGGTVGGGADGVSFCIQNDPRGPTALGGGGGSLGVGTADPITPSAELEFNLYTGNSEDVGYTFLTDGLTGSTGANGNYAKPGSVVIDSGDPINVSMVYDGDILSLTLQDAAASTSFSTNLVVGDLTRTVSGNTAYVGFTGGDGGVSSTQTIKNFSFVSIPLVSIESTDKTVVISWTGAILGYGVQQTPSLTNPTWVAVTNQVNVVNGLNEVAIPIGTTNEFYRLQLQ